MDGITGFCDFHDILSDEEYFWSSLVRRMRKSFSAGPASVCVTKHLALSTFGPKSGILEGPNTICFCGNPETDRLLPKNQTSKALLKKSHDRFGTYMGDTLFGSFACVLEDQLRDMVLLCSGKGGSLSIYYLIVNDRLVFATHKTCLFEYPGIMEIPGNSTSCKIFNAQTGSHGKLTEIQRLLPGQSAIYSQNGFRLLHR